MKRAGLPFRLQGVHGAGYPASLKGQRRLLLFVKLFFFLPADFEAKFEGECADDPLVWQDDEEVFARFDA